MPHFITFKKIFLFIVLGLIVSPGLNKLKAQSPCSRSQGNSSLEIFLDYSSCLFGMREDEKITVPADYDTILKWGCIL